LYGREVAVPLITPNPRLDMFVDRAPDGVRQRLTTYTGTIQFGARTSVLGTAAWGSLSTFEHAWLLPDSLPYRADRVAGSHVNAVIAPLSTNEIFDVHQLAAGLAPDPDQAHAWLKFDFVIATRSGTTASYRVDVMVPADAVHEPGP
jgi:hypothetical protein